VHNNAPTMLRLRLTRPGPAAKHRHGKASVAGEPQAASSLFSACAGGLGTNRAQDDRGAGALLPADGEFVLGRKDLQWRTVCRVSRGGLVRSCRRQVRCRSMANHEPSIAAEIAIVTDTFL